MGVSNQRHPDSRAKRKFGRRSCYMKGKRYTHETAHHFIPAKRALHRNPAACSKPWTNSIAIEQEEALWLTSDLHLKGRGEESINMKSGTQFVRLWEACSTSGMELVCYSEEIVRGWPKMEAEG